MHYPSRCLRNTQLERLSHQSIENNESISLKKPVTLFSTFCGFATHCQPDLRAFKLKIIMQLPRKCWLNMHACNIWRSATVGWTFKIFCAALAQNKHTECVWKASISRVIYRFQSALEEREKITQISTGESIIQINIILHAVTRLRESWWHFYKIPLGFDFFPINLPDWQPVDYWIDLIKIAHFKSLGWSTWWKDTGLIQLYKCALVIIW